MDSLLIKQHRGYWKGCYPTHLQREWTGEGKTTRCHLHLRVWRKLLTVSGEHFISQSNWPSEFVSLPSSICRRCEEEQCVCQSCRRSSGLCSEEMAAADRREGWRDRGKKSWENRSGEYLLVHWLYCGLMVGHVYSYCLQQNDFLHA